MSCYLRPRLGLLLLCCCYSSSNLYTSQGFSKSSTSKVGEERVISGWTQYLLSCHFPFSKSFVSSIKRKIKKSHKRVFQVNPAQEECTETSYIWDWKLRLPCLLWKILIVLESLTDRTHLATFSFLLVCRSDRSTPPPLIRISWFARWRSH